MDGPDCDEMVDSATFGLRVVVDEDVEVGSSTEAVPVCTLATATTVLPTTVFATDGDKKKVEIIDEVYVEVWLGDRDCPDRL